MTNLKVTKKKNGTRSAQVVSSEAAADTSTDPGGEGFPEDYPFASYLEKDGRFTTPGAVAGASDEDLESVSGLSGERIEKLRAYEA